jgi:hypothetical protein
MDREKETRKISDAPGRVWLRGVNFPTIVPVPELQRQREILGRPTFDRNYTVIYLPIYTALLELPVIYDEHSCIAL